LSSPKAASPGSAGLAIAALVLNALTWGLSWWPFRALQAQGLHPLWATALIYAVAVAVITAWRPDAWSALRRTRSLWPLVLAAGTTNAAFNWGVTVGDVVRVVLLFYLMPLWAVLLARWMLHEALSPNALWRVALSLTGAMIVLWPASGGAESLPLPHTLPEWLAVLGGFTFALNNVLLRREAHRPEAARALAMFLGGAAVAAVLALALTAQGRIEPPPPFAAGWLLSGLGLALVFLAGNLALQYGAGRLPAHITAVVMITEVLFASASAVWWGAGEPTARLVAGGLLIMAAAALSARE
jgi:drug/metabolite transporter (DMT)-like permease